jgi:hypothetical protein
MNSSIINILEILKAANNLKSLGFSSGYNYDQKSADEYFQELIQNGRSSAPIFAGILILEKAKDTDDFTIIDGLQRTTTLCLLLCALCDAYKGTSKINEDSRNKILTRYLSNQIDVKLRLKGKDKKIYAKMVHGEELTKREFQTNLFETYQLFFQRIKEKQISATQLFAIISRIQFMVVFTDPSKVPVREFYQSLNKDKDDSSQVNLITNLIKQNCGAASLTWKEMISAFKQLELPRLVKQFIRDFLTIQNSGKIPGEKALYNSFKHYFANISEYQGPQQIIDNLKKYSEFYLKIIQSDFEDCEIKNLILQINENNGQDSYPYLMEVLDDLENNLIDRDAFLEILNMINSFVSKRNDGCDNGGMTVSFASLSNELNKMIALKNYAPENSENGNLTINEINHLSTFEV